jgi:hypothetical protein
MAGMQVALHVKNINLSVVVISFVFGKIIGTPLPWLGGVSTAVHLQIKSIPETILPVCFEVDYMSVENQVCSVFTCIM